MPFLNYDGLISLDDEALFCSDNKAFRLGEGLIETMFRTGNVLRFLDLHIERLTESLKTIGFPPLNELDFRLAILKTISANGDPEHVIIRAQFFMNLNDNKLHYIIEAILPDHSMKQWPEKGLTIGVTQKAVKCYDSISHLKTSSRMQYQIAKKEAEANAWDDAILLNAHGRIAESTHSNIFIVSGKNIYTPPLNEGCIDGVMRKYLLTHEGFERFGISEKTLETEELQQADEIFLTNAVSGIQSVRSFMGKIYSHEVTRHIFNKLSEL